MVEPITFVRTEEQTMLGSTVRDFLAARSDVGTIQELSLTTNAIDRNVWDGLVDIGVPGLGIPEEYGGAGFGMPEMAIVCEELGRSLSPTPVLSCAVAAHAIVCAGSDGQKEALLPAIASGETIATLAVFEDAHGSHLEVPRTVARRTGGEWTISGTKRYVVDAPNAALFIVAAAVEGETALFAVPRTVPGVAVNAVNALDATRPLGEVSLADVVVDESALLADATGLAVLKSAIDVGVVGSANEQVGGAQYCMEMAVDHAKSRHQFGRPIGSFQAVKHMCADMLVAVEHARSVGWHAAMTIDDPNEAPVSVPLAKSVCSDAYLKVAGDTIQVLGGIGFTWEHPAHLYYKRAKSLSLLFGSVDLHRDRLADALNI